MLSINAFHLARHTHTHTDASTRKTSPTLLLVYMYARQTCRKSINERNKLAFDSEQAADMETVSVVLGRHAHKQNHILHTHTHECPTNGFDRADWPVATLHIYIAALRPQRQRPASTHIHGSIYSRSRSGPHPLQTAICHTCTLRARTHTRRERARALVVHASVVLDGLGLSCGGDDDPSSSCLSLSIDVGREVIFISSCARLAFRVCVVRFFVVYVWLVSSARLCVGVFSRRRA